MRDKVLPSHTKYEPKATSHVLGHFESAPSKTENKNNNKNPNRGLIWTKQTPKSTKTRKTQMRKQDSKKRWTKFRFQLSTWLLCRVQRTPLTENWGFNLIFFTGLEMSNSRAGKTRRLTFLIWEWNWISIQLGWSFVCWFVVWSKDCEVAEWLKNSRGLFAKKIFGRKFGSSEQLSSTTGLVVTAVILEMPIFGSSSLLHNIVKNRQ